MWNLIFLSWKCDWTVLFLILKASTNNLGNSVAWPDPRASWHGCVLFSRVAFRNYSRFQGEYMLPVSKYKIGGYGTSIFMYECYGLIPLVCDSHCFITIILLWAVATAKVCFIHTTFLKAVCFIILRMYVTETEPAWGAACILRSSVCSSNCNDPRNTLMILLRNLLAEYVSKCCGSRTVSFVWCCRKF